MGPFCDMHKYLWQVTINNGIIPAVHTMQKSMIFVHGDSIFEHFEHWYEILTYFLRHQTAVENLDQRRSENFWIP